VDLWAGLLRRLRVIISCFFFAASEAFTVISELGICSIQLVSFIIDSWQKCISMVESNKKAGMLHLQKASSHPDLNEGPVDLQSTALTPELREPVACAGLSLRP
jgi:hypothetical protein